MLLYRGIRNTACKQLSILLNWDVELGGRAPSRTVLLAPWWSRGEAVPYVGSGAGYAGTG